MEVLQQQLPEQAVEFITLEIYTKSYVRLYNSYSISLDVLYVDWARGTLQMTSVSTKPNQMLGGGPVDGRKILKPQLTYVENARNFFVSHAYHFKIPTSTLPAGRERKKPQVFGLSTSIGLWH